MNCCQACSIKSICLGDSVIGKLSCSDKCFFTLTPNQVKLGLHNLCKKVEKYLSEEVNLFAVSVPCLLPHTLAPTVQLAW